VSAVPVAHISVIVGDGTRLVPLMKHGKVAAYAVIDDADYHVVRPHRWRLSASGYAKTTFPGRREVYMQRLLLGLPPLRVDPREADHINRDRLDNRRRNLRVVTRSQNAQNQAHGRGASRQRNVHWHRASGLWSVRVNVDGQKHYFGYFRDRDEAAEVARRARARLMPFSSEGTLARQREAMPVAA
jgi:hypothetical protein